MSESLAESLRALGLTGSEDPATDETAASDGGEGDPAARIRALCAAERECTVGADELGDDVDLTSVGFDDLGLLTLAMLTEQTFDVELTDAEIHGARTVGDLVSAVRRAQQDTATPADQAGGDAEHGTPPHRP